MSERSNGAIVGSMMLAAGAMIGAGMALIYAPQSGRKTRRQLCRYSRKVRNEAEARIRDVSDSITDTMEDLSEKTSDLVDRSGEVTEEWRKYLIDTLERGQKELDRQRTRLINRWR